VVVQKIVVQIYSVVPVVKYVWIMPMDQQEVQIVISVKESQNQSHMYQDHRSKSRPVMRDVLILLIVGVDFFAAQEVISAWVAILEIQVVTTVIKQEMQNTPC